MRTVFLVLVLILAAELEIRWNHISEVQTIGTVGQLIPLVLGVGGLLEVVWAKGKMVWRGSDGLVNKAANDGDALATAYYRRKRIYEEDILSHCETNLHETTKYSRFVARLEMESLTHKYFTYILKQLRSTLLMCLQLLHESHFSQHATTRPRTVKASDGARTPRLVEPQNLQHIPTILISSVTSMSAIPFEGCGPPATSLIDLPGELLNLIYELALIQEQPIELWSEEAIDYGKVHPKTILGDSFRITRRRLGVGLLRTCRKFRNEASSFFFGANKLYFSGSGGWDGLFRFLIALDPRARSFIKCLGVFIPLEPGLYTAEQSTSLCRGEKWTPRSLKVLNNSGKVVRECCALMAKGKTLQQLTLIIPRGVAVTDLSRMFTDDLSDIPNVDPSTILHEALKLQEDVVLEVQCEGYIQMRNCCIWRAMAQRGWRLTRK
ncbi:MAG: hypothetical protein M1835_004952 [Candelina submexicana]|nr:MAG: hypothetical protein M1835_004952 [Candelina submexicana]